MIPFASHQESVLCCVLFTVLLTSSLLLLIQLESSSRVPPTKEYSGLKEVAGQLTGSWPSSRNGTSSLLPLQCDSCVLVGTAGTLLESSLAPAIDGASCVFRLGFSPVGGFEDNLGSKTTARIVDSYRFNPFLKHPEKLEFGRYRSNHWLIFDHRPSKDNIKYQEILKSFARKQTGVRCRWFTKKEEMDAIDSLKKFGGEVQYTMWKSRPSALWYAIRVAEDVGCRTLSVYGIPDPKICKRYPRMDVRSRYWDESSPPLCRDGHDAGFYNTTATAAEIPSLLERRALRFWSLQYRGTEVTFQKPSWPSS